MNQNRAKQQAIDRAADLIERLGDCKHREALEQLIADNVDLFDVGSQREAKGVAILRTTPPAVLRIVQQVLHMAIENIALREQLDVAAQLLEKNELSQYLDRVSNELIKTQAGRNKRESTRKRLSLLTPRQYEIALLACKGFSNLELAAHLGLSKYTVKSHLGNIYRKLGVKSRAEMTAMMFVDQIHPLG